MKAVSVEGVLQYPKLFIWGWTLFFAGVPFLGASSIGILLLLVHWGLAWRDLRTSVAIPGAMGLGRLNRSVPWMLAGFVTVGTVSALVSVDKQLAFASIFGMALAMSFGLVYTRTVQLKLQKSSPLWFLPLVWPLPVTASIHALWAIVEYLGGASRPTTVVGPNGVGTMMMISAGLGAAWFVGRTDWRKWLLVPYSLLVACGALVTLSRGAWIGLLALIAVAAMRAVWTRQGKWVMMAAICGLLIVAGTAAVSSPSLSHRISSITIENNMDRVAIYQGAWSMFIDHPWLGVGPGLFGAFWDTYRPEWDGPGHHGFAHNLELQALSETGLLGAFFFVGLLFVAVLAGWRLRRSHPWPTWLLYATFVAWIVRDQFDGSLLNINDAIVFWSIAGIMLGCAFQPSPDEGVASTIGKGR